MKTSLALVCLALVSCNKNSGGPTSTKLSCPETIASSSGLPLNPGPASAVPLHANGTNTTWNWQLLGSVNTSHNVDVYDVDLFDTPPSTIAALQASGKKVVCYFSAGSSENWRSDHSLFNTEDMGKPLDGWAGERWLDIRSQNVLDVMEARLDLAVTKGCDGVEPDNMDGYTQDSCFDLSANDQLAYNRAIANLARSKGLSVGLKNDPDQVATLVSYFDFSVSEQCYQFNECASYVPFVTVGKPVFNAEYATAYRSNPAQSDLCTYSNGLDIQTIVFSLNLDNSYRYQCF